MALPVMTVLTESGNLFNQERGMPAAMGGMADGAVFLDWRMFINKWSSFFRMTLVAELVHILRLDHAVRCLGAMWIMAVSAIELAFDDRMM